MDEPHQRFLHDLATDIEEAHDKGRGEGIAIGVDKGIEIGIGKGKYEEKHEIARRMKSEGCDAKFIARMTGLSSDVIERLD